MAVFVSPERAVISLLLQLIAGLLIYLILGETEVKSDVRLLVALSPLLAWPLMFLWKLLSIPAAIHHEQRREEENERKIKVWYLGQIYAKGVDPEDAKLIDYGFALPPENWMNQKLEEFGMKWRVKVLDGAEYVTEDIA